MASSDRPSPKPLLEKEASAAVFGGRENSGNALDASNASNYWGFGGFPAVCSRGIPGKALRAFTGSLRIFSEFLPDPVLGVCPN